MFQMNAQYIDGLEAFTSGDFNLENESLGRPKTKKPESRVK